MNQGGSRQSPECGDKMWNTVDLAAKWKIRLFTACSNFIIYSACRTLLLCCEYLAEYFISVYCAHLGLETLKYKIDLFALDSRSWAGGFRRVDFVSAVWLSSPAVLKSYNCVLFSGSEELKRMAHSKARVTDGKVTYPPGVKEISDKISKEEMVRRLKVSESSPCVCLELNIIKIKAFLLWLKMWLPGMRNNFVTFLIKMSDL